jgi:hypothetical protein
MSRVSQSVDRKDRPSFVRHPPPSARDELSLQHVSPLRRCPTFWGSSCDIFGQHFGSRVHIFTIKPGWIDARDTASHGTKFRTTTSRSLFRQSERNTKLHIFKTMPSQEHRDENSCAVYYGPYPTYNPVPTTKNGNTSAAVDHRDVGTPDEWVTRDGYVLQQKWSRCGHFWS